MIRLESLSQLNWSKREGAGKLTAVSLPTTIEASLLFTVCALFLARIQYAIAGLAGTDGYYHIKMGYLLRQEGLTPTFDHLPFTILNQAAYYDHHLLFHGWLALFAHTDPLVDGGVALTQAAKLTAVLMAAFAFVAIWWVLKSEQIPYAALWTVSLLVLSDAFLYRMSLTRAQSLSLLLLAVSIHLLLKERFIYLIPLGFVYVWAYNAFPLLVVVGGIYLIASLMSQLRFVWQAVVYPAIGVGLGLLINPYFPQNILFTLSHLAPKLGESATKVGNEWLPYRTWTLVENSTGALALLVLALFAIGWQKERMDKRTLFGFGLMLFFGGLLLESRRFVEYFPPMVLLFAAFAVAPLLQDGAVKQWLRDGNGWVVTAVFLLILIPAANRTLNRTIDLMHNSKPADQYAAAALWLHANAPDNAQIFQTDWDDFTRLFFYNSDVRYTAGLDPTFMELHDAALFELWVDITQGKVEAPSQSIVEQFNASYVITDHHHDAFIAEANRDSGLVEVYQDGYAIIYQVNQQN